MVATNAYYIYTTMVVMTALTVSSHNYVTVMAFWQYISNLIFQVWYGLDLSAGKKTH